jgi:hypothetical protein
MQIIGGKIDLKATQTRNGSGWSANLSGKIGESAYIIAQDGRCIRKLVTRQLHSIAGIAGKQNNYRPSFINGVLRIRRCRRGRSFGH